MRRSASHKGDALLPPPITEVLQLIVGHNPLCSKILVKMKSPLKHYVLTDLIIFKQLIFFTNLPGVLPYLIKIILLACTKSPASILYK